MRLIQSFDSNLGFYNIDHASSSRSQTGKSFFCHLFQFCFLGKALKRLFTSSVCLHLIYLERPTQKMF